MLVAACLLALCSVGRVGARRPGCVCVCAHMHGGAASIRAHVSGSLGQLDECWQRHFSPSGYYLLMPSTASPLGCAHSARPGCCLSGPSLGLEVTCYVCSSD